MTRVYISLGSNIGDRRRNITRAFEAFMPVGIELKKNSSFYETAPRDFLNQPWFLNLVAECRTNLSPFELLAKLLQIELDLGRNRTETAISRGPRLIDLDILLFGDQVINTAALRVPHPRMLERRFVLEPLLEIAPDLIYPVSREPLANSLPLVNNQEISKIG